MELTKDESSLLLFMETAVVDQGGLADSRRLNSDDWDILTKWKETKFADFGRVFSKDLERLATSSNRFDTWFELSEEAFKLSHRERYNRAQRMKTKRTWLKTSETR